MQVCVTLRGIFNVPVLLKGRKRFVNGQVNRTFQAMDNFRRLMADFQRLVGRVLDDPQRTREDVRRLVIELEPDFEKKFSDMLYIHNDSRFRRTHGYDMVEYWWAQPLLFSDTAYQCCVRAGLSAVVIFRRIASWIHSCDSFMGSTWYGYDKDPIFDRIETVEKFLFHFHHSVSFCAKDMAEGMADIENLRNQALYLLSPALPSAAVFEVGQDNEYSEDPPSDV